MLFQHLTLYTTQLQAQKQFYTHTLGLELLEDFNHSFSLKVGRSILSFEQGSPQPPYHYAINIPPFQEKEALVWLKERVEVLPDTNGEIIDFSNWNARALYFFDADKNIVELISRRNLPYPSQKPFGVESLREISEMGISTMEMEQVCAQIQSELNTSIFDGAPIKFCAIGEETGLFICVDAKNKIWYPTQIPAKPANFKLAVKKENMQRIVEYDKGVLKVYD